MINYPQTAPVHQPPCASTDGSCVQVNERLQTKVYLAGPNVTLADLVLFSTLHRALVCIEYFAPAKSELPSNHRVTIVSPKITMFVACRSTSLELRSLSGIPTYSAGLTSCSTLLMLIVSIQSSPLGNPSSKDHLHPQCQ